MNKIRVTAVRDDGNVLDKVYDTTKTVSETGCRTGPGWRRR